ncbi:hypothetical protein EMIT0P253_30111 [Pseudomonas sp. IT-P253]
MIARTYRKFRVTPNPSGSELAREGAGTFNINIDWHYAFASKLAPTGSGCDLKKRWQSGQLICATSPLH